MLMRSTQEKSISC